MQDFSYVMSADPVAIESLYNNYLKDPASVDPEWVRFFEGFDFAYAKAPTNGIASKNGTANGATLLPEQMEKEFGVFRLIRSYRKRGHLIATTNPIIARKDRKPYLNLADFGLTDADLSHAFQAGKFTGMKGAKLSEIIAHLKKVYAGDVGIEYTYITDKARCGWIEREFEQIQTIQLSMEQKKRILLKLNEGVIFEKFLHTKYIGQKRFSLEGGESTIPALDTILNESAIAGVKEVVIGMAHRGRLNVLANTLGKTYKQIFSEFEGNMPKDTAMGSGDVKYHLGFRANIKTVSGIELNVQLTPNPSHLEVVDPVVAGFARAKADVLYDNEYDKVLPVLIHGDSAISGLGVVYELLQMSMLKGYSTGGTIHFVINNQIGFTTDFEDARSADYCTSIASMVQAPVLHVNGDDPEAVVKAAMIAVKYRQEYNQDIFIDMVCYRRHGHNEGDDPSFTQPKMYEVIKTHPNPREVYNKQLMERDHLDGALAKEMEDDFWTALQERLDDLKQKPLPYMLQGPEKAWQNLNHAVPSDFITSPETGMGKEAAESLFYGLMKIKEGFNPLRKIRKLLDEKIKLYEEKGLLDWSSGELLAYASLLQDGKEVRFSGQDVQRGTFSHRHAILHDEQTNEEYNRVNGAVGGGHKFHIYNSPLNEFAVLGFEYGYSIANPDTLTVWEAQFGDFANGCQTVIDQYIISGETKWQKMSGLVMLLPHGYEGQGPEHSSARLERFLQLCADNNVVITNISTSANFFHAMRRQLAWNFRKPLINCSPKANLRQSRAASHISEFAKGSFQQVLDDPAVRDVQQVKRVILCSGKIYFNLTDKLIADNRTDIAVIRLEQIYPIPVTQLTELKKKYEGTEWIWVQEEPRNMGALGFLILNLPIELAMKEYISRPAMSASATGFSKMHAIEQTAIVDKALTL